LPIPNAQKMADRTEKGKKRKRRQEGSSKPSKRVAIEGDKQVEISLHEADEWGPVIGMYSTTDRRKALHFTIVNVQGLISNSFYSRSYNSFLDRLETFHQISCA
jgi:hypothetical protein